MPAKSEAQQRFMGMVLARKRGKKVGSAKVAKAAASMTTADVKDFAATRHKGLPKKKRTAKQHFANFITKSAEFK